MTETISTTQAAAMLKAALRAAYPDVTFSVRENRGSAANWLDVFYTDGPTSKAVRQIADQYTGERYNGQTEAYELVADRLVQFDGEDVPRLVRYAVSGVVVSRTMGAAGVKAVAARIVAVAPDVECLDRYGNLARAPLSEQEAERVCDLRWVGGPAVVADIAWSVFYALDLTAG